MPSAGELADWSARRMVARPIDDHVLAMISRCNFDIEAMDVLRTTISCEAHWGSFRNG